MSKGQRARVETACCDMSFILKNHWSGVMVSVTGITNTVTEGINRLIRMAKNRPNLKRFRYGS